MNEATETITIVISLSLLIVATGLTLGLLTKVLWDVHKGRT
jgi:hypothetical protein